LIAIAVVAADGTKVFVSSHRDRDLNYKGTLFPGTYQVEVQVPEAFLNFGTYSLNVQVRGQARGDVVRPHAHKLGALSFTVEDTGSAPFRFGGRRHGVVTPTLDWDVVETSKPKL
jgi:hypothetical protein